MPVRLDRWLHEQGLAESRSRAQALIAAGVVRVGGAVATKASVLVPVGAAVSLDRDPCPWVSRAGLKLAHALDAFGLAPSGDALDLGASTGGFTEVLLARGAARVFAVDVGHGQMHPRVASDTRVTLLEGVNARAIPAGLVPEVDWITADLSFIALGLVLPSVLPLARRGGTLVALVKPQFEAGPGAVGKGGLVTDPAVHARVRSGVRRIIEAAGWRVAGETGSPIAGGDGNREFLIAARAP